MKTINTVQAPIVQSQAFSGINKNNIRYSKSTEPACDTVCFKAMKPKNSINFFKKIFGLTSAGAAGVAAAKITNEEASKVTEDKNDEWNSSCKGYKILVKAGFSEELIDKTINKMEKEEVDSLKKGFDNVYIKGSEGRKGIISGIYDAFNKDYQDDEKSAEVTFKLLSEIFKRSKEDRIYLYGVYASIKYEGASVFEKGSLSDGGLWGNNFTFLDKEGNNLGSDRLQERFDSDGNKIVERVDCDGNVSKDGKKYDKDDRLIEDWDEFTRTDYHYNENGVLFEKVKHTACATETLRLVDGEWKSDKEGGWKDW